MVLANGSDGERDARGAGHDGARGPADGGARGPARAGTVVRYLVSKALSLTGNSIAGVVLPLVLLSRTGDVLAAGSLALICAVPQFFLGLAGGALLDRASRRRVSIASDLVSATSVALLPVVDATFGLSFGWFVALGLLGAVGDVPGMTARDALLPEVCERDGVDLQRFVGASQSMQALVSIVGPAVAALLMGWVGDVAVLWLTAALSASAALVTSTLPREVGMPPAAREGAAGAGTGAAAAGDPASGAGASGLLGGLREVLVGGMRALFGTDRLLRCAMLLSLGISMVMGSFQGIVLPAHFTAAGQPQMVGFVVSSMGAGLLAGSVLYTALSARLSRRAWFVGSMAGMLASVVALGSLPSPLALLGTAALVGLFAGPASSLLSFFAYDRVDPASLGTAMGTLNALYLVVAPAGALAGSVLVGALGTDGAGAALSLGWAVACAASLWSPALRRM